MSGAAKPATALDRPEGGARVLSTIAKLTIASGAFQAIAPARVLGTVGADRGPTARHLFGTIGMFMVVSGGTLHRETSTGHGDPALINWAAAQKLGAATAVIIGVRRRIFSRRALLVASFDLGSGLLCVAYARQLRRNSAG